MDARDQQAIDELFRKIADVAQRSGPRDREAEAYIRSLIAENPAAAYYMAQTIIVQEQALNAAQARIEELERQPARRSSGGFLESLFGGGSRHSASYSGPRAHGRSSYGQASYGHMSPGQPYGYGRGMGMGMGGGGFLAGAAQTAMGVAGGVVLGSMLSDMLSPDEAAAAGIGDTADAGAGDLGADTGDAGTDMADAGDFGGDLGGGDFGGGDFGDFG